MFKHEYTEPKLLPAKEIKGKEGDDVFVTILHNDKCPQGIDEWADICTCDVDIVRRNAQKMNNATEKLKTVKMKL